MRYIITIKDLKSRETRYYTGMNKFFSIRPTFRARKKMGVQNQSIYPIEKQLERLLFVLYYLNTSFH